MVLNFLLNAMQLVTVLDQISPADYFFPATFHPYCQMRPAAIQDWHLLYEVLNQSFEPINSNDSWQCLCI